MRSWNFVTFDQISGRVTTEAKHQKAGAPRRQLINSVRYFVPAIVVGAMVLANMPTSQTLPGVYATSITASLSMGQVISSVRLRPPFYDKFSVFLTEAYLSTQAESFRALASAGSSDQVADSARVVAAVAISEDEYEWRSAV